MATKAETLTRWTRLSSRVNPLRHMTPIRKGAPEFDYITKVGNIIKVRNIRTLLSDRRVHCEVWATGDSSFAPCDYSQAEFAPVAVRIVI